MRDVLNRQLPLLAGVLFYLGNVAVAVRADEVDPATAELEALKAQAIALSVRRAELAEWRKLEGDYAALAGRYPKNAAIRDAYGDFLWGMNDHEAAVREWKAGEKLEPNNAAILNHLGGAAMAQGEPRTALDYYLRATEAEPGNAHTHYSVANIAGLFRHDLGRTEEECFALALKHYAEAHRLAPGNAEFARGYAETFYTVPRPDWRTALKVWTSYLNLVPEKNFALLNLTRVHMKLGDPESARTCLAQVTGEKNARLKSRLAARIEEEFSSVNGPGLQKTETKH